MLLKPDSLRAPLRACGYRPNLLVNDFLVGEDVRIPLLGFAQVPTDSRSSCVAVISATDDPRTAVEDCRAIGAPLVFVCFQDTLQWWKQGTTSAEWLETIPEKKVERFFRDHKDEFSPDAVYRAKTWGRFRSEYQLTFVDVGLMPLVEEEVGEALGQLIERNVSELKKRLGWEEEVTSTQGHWLLKTVFWLVSGKILRDKQVATFDDLNLNDVEDVFQRVATHYDTESFEAGSKRKLEALKESAHSISQFSSLALTTTEALAYVYERTLISKQTRSALGTHSTPSFLVDYILGHLADWIEEIPENDRCVFEPACGHAAFLVSAMRLLTQLLPTEKSVPSRRGPYLRSRLHGTDVDAFALELARLSLTLTDIPNPDGWDLRCEDMFLEERLSAQASNNTIFLANPPFDNFTPQQQRSYRKKKSEIRFFNKAAEMTWRVLPKLPLGGVFGIVLPQTFLHSDNAAEVREFLVRECELREVCLFPDKVFSFSDAESVILVGRRRRVSSQQAVRYRRVREREIAAFRTRYEASTTRNVLQSRFLKTDNFSLRLPDLEVVWDTCSENPKLGDITTLGQGLAYHGKDLPPGSTTYSETRFEGGHRGYVHFDRGVMLHQLPSAFWMNLDPSVIHRPRTGTTTGVPQVLLNYAPVSRGPWRLKALIDDKGRPATSNFITVRPRESHYSLPVIWSILNSPIANAYAYCHLGKRHNIVGDMRQIPFPAVDSFAEVEQAARAYLDAVAEQRETAALRNLLLDVDVEVLKLYFLPIELERVLLDLFSGYDRVGVPFTQVRYLPEAIDHPMRLADFRSFSEDWSRTNRQRHRLITKDLDGSISHEEQVRLQSMQAYADYHLDQIAPRPTHVIDEIESQLFTGMTYPEEQD